MSDLTPAEKASVIRQVEAIPKRRRSRVVSTAGPGLDDVLRMYRAYKVGEAEAAGPLERFIIDSHDAAMLKLERLFSREQDVMRRARADLERKFLDWER